MTSVLRSFRRPPLRAPLRFLLAGGLSALVSWTTCLLLMNSGTSVSVAGAVAYLSSIPAGYLLHRLFTFEVRSPVGTDICRFVVVSLCSAWAAGLTLSVMLRHTTFEIALLLTVLVVAPINFTLLKAWVFATGRRRPAIRSNDAASR